jgi:hypothetical protein
MERQETQLAEQLQGYGHGLLGQCACAPGVLQEAKLQGVSNLVWAASVLGWYDRGFFSHAASTLLQALLVGSHVKPQELSNALLACATCAHWDRHVQQLLEWVAGHSLADFTLQHLANTLHAWAVLTCIAKEAGADQQQVQQLGQVAGALFKEPQGRWAQDPAVFVQEGLFQLFQAHMYAVHLGVPQQLEGGLLDQARAAWWAHKHIVGDSEREVASALRRMGCTIRTQPQASNPDELMRPDIVITALPNGTSCSIAVEYDGKYHYITEQAGSGVWVDRLDGPTRLRNALSRARFPDGVLVIPWKEWVAATKAGQQEEYLRRALDAVMQDKVREGGHQ